MKFLAIVPALLLLAGCANSHTAHATRSGDGQGDGRDRIVAKASPAQEQALLGSVKELKGKWQMQDEAGKADPDIVYEVSSNGSVVREVMFPGADHEMTNLYHMDGQDLVMTHYCAVGNQPRMRASSKSGNTIHFAYETSTNHTSMGQPCMREMSLEVKDQDHIVQHWRSFKDGKPMPAQSFELVRMK